MFPGSFWIWRHLVVSICKRIGSNGSDWLGFSLKLSCFICQCLKLGCRRIFHGCAMFRAEFSGFLKKLAELLSVLLNTARLRILKDT